jgi:N-acetylglucosaminyldiphosphoundecaprenol N-acetyl-beta-D-mannosaminyltransferase
MAGPLHVPTADLPRFHIAGVPINAVNMELACQEIERRRQTKEGGYCIFRDMNGVVGAHDNPALLRAHQNAALVTPDGMPLVWLARLRGLDTVHRVYGPDLMLELCGLTEHSGHRHFLFGSSRGVLDRLVFELKRRFPHLNICGSYSPPVRPATEAPNLDDVERIRATQPDFVWVGLGTPKQELWMQANSALLPGIVLLGVGAAFDFHAKMKRQAPRWMQRSGLEWCFRLATEPRRLWRRYLIGIPRFLLLLAKYR